MSTNLAEELEAAVDAIEMYLCEVNKLPYRSGSGLEYDHSTLLEQCGFIDGTSLYNEYFKGIHSKKKDVTAAQLSIRKAIRDRELVLLREIEPFTQGLWFVDQPLGETEHPDKLIIIYGRVILVEEKSSEKSRIQLNNTCPHPKTLYVVSDKRTNGTRAMFGECFITQELYDFNIKAREEFRKLDSKFRAEAERLRRPDDPLIAVFARPTHSLIGGNEKYDFVTRHDDEGWHERTVTRFFGQAEKGVRDYLRHK